MIVSIFVLLATAVFNVGVFIYLLFFPPKRDR
jgi:hypothetical protein